MAASVVVFPEFVGPVTRIRPFFWDSSFLRVSGNPNPSSVGILLGMIRKAPANPTCFL